MVYVHGESFEWGSGNPYDGSILASHGRVVVVTLNYRLGVLGFLKTSGRNEQQGTGLHDQLAALHWLQENVGAFGGDPARITIFGHGTGAALVNLHLLSKITKGIIRRAILMSGSALSPWGFLRDPLETKKQVGESLNCSLERPDREDLAPCLRLKSLFSLLNAEPAPPAFTPAYGPFVDLNMVVSSPDYLLRRYKGETDLLVGVTTAESFLDLNDRDVKFGFEE
ncbi:unnamed protein product, partial [Darwinula stevensoni]